MKKRKIDVIDASSDSLIDWVRIHTAELKTHYVHKSFLAQLIADLESRGHHVLDQVPSNTAYMEFPSFVNIVGRPNEHIKIDLLNITIPSKDVSIAVDTLNRLPVRMFNDGEIYFKFKSITSCIIFSKDQYEMFTVALMTLTEQADTRDKIFMENTLKNMKKHEEDA